MVVRVLLVALLTVIVKVQLSGFLLTVASVEVMLYSFKLLVRLVT